jgi:solute carrier family 13 (sodium-dependent dicarboxylate transporter), member 2/3/5
MNEKSAKPQGVIAQRTILEGNSLRRDGSALTMRWLLAASTVTAITAISLTLIEDPLLARTLIVAGACLTLWLSEVVPPYVPTLVLWALVPLLLQPFGAAFRLSSVLGWAADPVLALFLGGFALSVAASRYGIDAQIARIAVKLSGGRRLRLLVMVASATALLSMWMSNIAAAAMMIAALHPLLADMPRDNKFRRALLVGIALGANFGGIATPIGTGPNAIAIAAVSKQQTITFLHWMTFALPLTIGMLAAGLALTGWRFRVRGEAHIPELLKPQSTSRGAGWVVAIFSATVLMWLSEPLHGVPSALVSLMTTAVLFGSGLLKRQDISRIDWSTLLLIAGGISLGNLLQQSGAVKAAAALVPWEQVPHLLLVLMLCLASALLSALMSNTAAATMLIPLAASLDPSPSIAILVAISSSFGIPFVISTPPNAMVYGEGGIRPSDLFSPGIVLMLLGCLLVALTGPFVLKFIGVM